MCDQLTDASHTVDGRALYDGGFLRIVCGDENFFFAVLVCGKLPGFSELLAGCTLAIFFCEAFTTPDNLFGNCTKFDRFHLVYLPLYRNQNFSLA